MLTTEERLFDWTQAFASPPAAAIAGLSAAALLAGWIAYWALSRVRRWPRETLAEFRRRLRGWTALAPALVGAALLGAIWVFAAVAALSLACYLEFARLTGLVRERAISLVVIAGILLVSFACLDHWIGLFALATPLAAAALLVAAVLPDQPEGFTRRVALGFSAFVFFGIGLGHLGYLANDEEYRPMLLMLMFVAEMHEVASRLGDRWLGRTKLAPNTRADKTVEGSALALVAATAAAAALGHFVFRGTALDAWPHWIAMGLFISAAGLLGELALGAIARDLRSQGVESAPSRFAPLEFVDGLMLAAPVFYHYVAYFIGLGLNQPPRILTGP